MTEKRFTKYVPDSYGYTYITTIIDNEKNKQTGNIDEIVDMLNELNDKCEFLEIENESLEDGATKYAELYHKSLKENEQLKIRFNEEREKSLKFCRNIDTLTIENEHIKNTIQEAYHNERTQLGKSVLKQLMETIQ